MKNAAIILAVVVALEALLIIVFGGRMLHDMQKLYKKAGSKAIATGMRRFLGTRWKIA